jgi:hypothetical protein
MSTRTTVTTDYKVETDILETESGIEIVNGALHTYNNELRYAVNDAFVTVYPQGSDYTETIVNITSAQILDMHNTGVELLPAAGVNRYYDIEKVILEYTHVTTAYTSAETLLEISSSSLPSISTAILIKNDNSVIVINGGSDGIDLINETVVKSDIGFNTAITLNCFNGEAFTRGDGTLRAIITYTVRTFGA